MIGPGHAGVVKQGGGVGLTRVGEDEIFCGGIEVRRSWVKESVGLAIEVPVEQMEAKESIPAVSWFRRSTRWP